MFEYCQKAVVSGRFVELYLYQKSQFQGLSTCKSSGLSTSIERRRDDNVYRTRKTIRRLVNSNDDLVKFVTLTFRENLREIKSANFHFKTFIQRLKRRYPNFKYLSVIEFQKRGAVHYHFLADLPFIKNKELSGIWQNGFVKINEISNCDNVGAYVSKYIGKEEQLEKYKKKFFASKNLEKPKEIVGEKVDKLFCSAKYELIYEKTVQSKYRGEIQYKQFRVCRQ